MENVQCYKTQGYPVLDYAGPLWNSGGKDSAVPAWRLTQQDHKGTAQVFSGVLLV